MNENFCEKIFFEDFTKIENLTFENFFSTTIEIQNWNFSKIWPKSFFFFKLTKIEIFENLTEIEISRKFDQNGNF